MTAAAAESIPAEGLLTMLMLARRVGDTAP
jgi:hypothetical protein